MDRPGGIPGGLVSQIKNRYSGKSYTVSTAPEIGEDYWTTGILSMIERRAFFGLTKKLVADPYQPLAVFVRNSQDRAHDVHHAVKTIVSREREESWRDLFPPLATS